ncbi:MAG TPA: carotenoid oxygenase family protein, partial [Chloroflexota bacterium]|nr:carotenoid oxygenase family protein [Chloroflexota bacterium]
MVDFAPVPTKVGYFAPERFEAELFDCEVQGQIPRDLEGTFFRVGGDWLYPPKFADDAVLNSDGYISAFRFHGGVVGYKGRYVRTKRLEADRAANRQLYGYYRNPYTDDPSIKDPSRPNLRTVSNTSPLIHAGKLFTLKEDGLPHRIDPLTLETLGTWDFDGAWKSETFTAHPKLDPVSGEMVAFGYEATGLATNDVFIYTIDKHGKVTHEIRTKTPYLTMLHDVALTQKHFIIPMCGYVTSLERLKEGKIHWGWDNSKPGYIGVLSRTGDGKDIRWFKGPQRCMMHTFNAYTSGDKIVLYAPFWDGNFFPFFPNVDGSPWDPKRARAFIRRITLDLKSKSDTWKEEILFPFPIV